MPLFVSDDGRVLAPTARAVWDKLIGLHADHPALSSAAMVGDAALQVYELLHSEAETHGRSVFSELMDAHRERQAGQRKKGRRAFDARRKAVERIGLPGVRQHRLRELDREEQEWRRTLNEQDAALPELTALMMLRVAGDEEEL
jgi:hypothetical protein